MLLVLFLVAAQLVSAQWTAPKTTGIPRTRDGTPNLTAKTPQTAYGKPDLSGLWAFQDEAYWYDIGAELGPEGVPMHPWAAALYRERRENEGRDNPLARCMPAGVPTIHTIPLPFKILQSPDLLAILYEYNMEYRQIFTDGRALPRDPNPNWLGYSVGRWQGDTLVVETSGLKDGTWLDLFGHPASSALHVTERFRRRDFRNMDMEITMTDPYTYTKPWKLLLPLKLLPDNEILEWVCVEGNRGMEHMVGK